MTYILADEPLTFGHYFAKGAEDRVGCRYSIERTAASFAENVREIESVFPNASVVDTEALDRLQSTSDLESWIHFLKADLGAGAPTLMQLDVQWNRPWQQNANAVVSTLAAAGWGYGIIYDGAPKQTSDDAWVQSAKQNIVAWESTVTTGPANIMIQSWEPHPSRLLPETDPTTLPSLVDYYCRNGRYRGACGTGT